METVILDKELLMEDATGQTKEAMLLEAADRFEYFFKRIDGDFEYPRCHPQIQQVLDMVAMSIHGD